MHGVEGQGWRQLEAKVSWRAIDVLKTRRANVRGVSGGERKRVTLAEMLVGQARVLAMDEISNGLVRTLQLGSSAASCQ